MIALLIAYAQGRNGVLDDRGVVIETEYCGEWIPGSDSSEMQGGELDSEVDHESAECIEDSDDTIPRRLPKIAFSIGRLVLGILAMLWFVGLSWRVGGWVGHSLLGVPGALGNIAGVAGCLLVWAGLIVLGNRLTAARRHLRSLRGTRDLDDLLVLFDAVDQYGVCGACMFSINDLNSETDGCLRCPECGAAWDRNLWADFLQTDRYGFHSGITKKERKRSCLLDARRQMMQVLTQQSPEVRKAKVGECRARLATWDLFVLLLILLLLFSGIAAALGWGLTPHQTTGGYIAITIAVIVLSVVAVAAVLLTREGIWRKKLQRLVRDRIDERVCPSCEEPLEEFLHPLDGAIVCIGCGLAWDPATESRKHHTRKRVSSEQFKNDPVFHKPLH